MDTPKNTGTIGHNTQIEDTKKTQKKQSKQKAKQKTKTK